MKILYLFILSITVSSWGQINNHWQLGNSDVNFSNNPPTVNSTGAVTQYGNATMSDADGNLLFYTNGKTIWNKNHQIMQNDNSNSYSYYEVEAEQPVIILPYPGQNKYYVITQVNDNIFGENLYLLNYRYMIVDFTTNPLGQLQVLSTSQAGSTTYYFYDKLIYNNDINGEVRQGGLTYAKKNSGNGYWIILTSNQNGLNCFSLDSSGFNETPIYSPLNDYTTGTSVRTMFKFNTNNLLGILESTNFIGTDSKFSTINFNNTTGVFSNHTLINNINPLGQLNANGFEFSSDSQKVYFVGQDLIVKDLSAPSVVGRKVTTLPTLPTIPNYNPFIINSYHIQKDKYENILIVGDGQNYLSKIIDQNLFATSSFNQNFLLLNSNFNNYAGPWDIQRAVLPQVILGNTPSVTYYCNNPIILNTETNTGSIVYDNYSTITTETNYNLTLSTQDVTLKANNYILLKPNTHIKSGSKFIAKIQPCNLIQTGRYNNSYKDENNELIKSNFDIIMYPNPANSIVTFNSTEERINKITIVSLDGKQVINQLVNNLNEFQLNVSILENGIYIVSIETKEGKTHTQKLIKN